MTLIYLPFISSTFFGAGVTGILLNRTSILVILMSLEICLLSSSLNFAIFSVLLGDLMGQIFALYILAVASCESSIGLAIVLSYFRVRGNIRAEEARMLRS